MLLEPPASYIGVVGIYVTKHDQTCLRTLESDQLDQNCELCASISGTSQYTGDATVILRKRFALKKWLGCLDGPNQVRISESNPLRCFLAVVNISRRSGKIPRVCARTNPIPPPPRVRSLSNRLHVGTAIAGIRVHEYINFYISYSC